MFALIEYWNGGYKGRVLGIYTTKEAAKAAMPMDYTDVQEEGWEIIQPNKDGNIELGDDLIRADLVKAGMEW